MVILLQLHRQIQFITIQYNQNAKSFHCRKRKDFNNKKRAILHKFQLKSNLNFVALFVIHDLQCLHAIDLFFTFLEFFVCMILSILKPKNQIDLKSQQKQLIEIQFVGKN
eukprot:TRINITY_DN2305_c1_g2_i3.p9 TRINITY_DN2305_c1_g2~~TRINITY_DN2305_c1_g2_i3.p9  ORF type:complete len:110 (-),score=0.46 TRINITY_DN2305_c1_g2_i3:851-1180(-)